MTLLKNNHISAESLVKGWTAEVHDMSISHADHGQSWRLENQTTITVVVESINNKNKSVCLKRSAPPPVTGGIRYYYSAVFRSVFCII